MSTLEAEDSLMTTERQIEANRANASKSTGPRTVEGKERSKVNATTHGLAGESTSLGAAMADAFATRHAQWSEEFRPVGASADFAFDQLIAASIRLEQCDRALDGVIINHSTRAGASWEDDRRLDAAELASKLAHDPLLISRRLAVTFYGCELLLTLWGRLGESLLANRTWTDQEASRALDLLGIPTDLRRGATPLDPDDDLSPFLHLQRVATEQFERLQASMRRLAPVDALDREQAEAGVVALLSKPAQLLMRYERDAWRHFREATKTLRTPAPEPLVESKPVAQPVAKPVEVPVEVEEPEDDPVVAEVGKRIKTYYAEVDARRARAYAAEEAAYLAERAAYSEDGAAYSDVDITSTPPLMARI